ncbi:tetratricopeptide repeat protein [Roseobacter sp. HKCCA0434]|uniref:tetratricopeptide repeat protein n=1 Tax=Roseobacter sp. HKCCA0434 TaxID=3079297 RepID=UPI002905CA45|nr:tetratricopeptide repeat protein [Roseobacter sp. HKCCA0434]
MRRVSIALASLAVALGLAGPAAAQERTLPELLAELSQPEARDVDGLVAEIYRRWSRSGSRSMDLLVARGQSALEMGDARRAVEHFSAAIENAPEFAEAWNGRATAWYVQGEYGLSLADIRVTLALNPQHFGALTGLGLILEETGDLARAYRAFRMAEAINPHQPAVDAALDRLSRILGSEA